MLPLTIIMDYSKACYDTLNFTINRPVERTWRKKGRRASCQGAGSQRFIRASQR